MEEIGRQAQQPNKLELPMANLPVSISASTTSLQKHTSMIYGLEFSCKAPLFRRHQSNLLNFEQMEKEAIFHKVHAFLTKLISNPLEQAGLIAALQFKSTGLIVSKSASSISSTNSLKGARISQHNSPDSLHFASLRNGLQEGQRVSLMSKSNRISITNAIPEESKSKLMQRLNTLIEEDAVQSGGDISAKSIEIKSGNQVGKDNGSINNGSINNGSINNGSINISSNNTNQSKQDIHSGVNMKFKSRKQLELNTDHNKQNTTSSNANVLEQGRNTSIICYGQIDIPSESLLSSNNSLEELPTNIPTPPLSISLIEAIYESPAPFLINLSLCLLLKYLACSQVRLGESNVGWAMSISTIIAYKIYYDQPIQGLIDSMGSILDTKTDTVIALERHFLKAISYQAVITNQQYHQVLSRIIK